MRFVFIDSPGIMNSQILLMYLIVSPSQNIRYRRRQRLLDVQGVRKNYAPFMSLLWKSCILNGLGFYIQLIGQALN